MNDCLGCSDITSYCPPSFRSTYASNNLQAYDGSGGVSRELAAAHHRHQVLSPSQAQPLHQQPCQHLHQQLNQQPRQHPRLRLCECLRLSQLTPGQIGFCCLNTPHPGHGQAVRPYSPQPVSPLARVSFSSYAQPSNMPRESIDEDQAAFQKLSDEYTPELKGPLIREKQPCHVIVDEYAEGDPVYRVKTRNLAKNYAWFRACKGDGDCGWRAIAFGYFESLSKLGSSQKMRDEMDRLQAQEKLLTDVGHEKYIFEDFAEHLYDIYRRLASCILSVEGDGILLQSFNDEIASSYIITHLKLLTSAWLQLHPAQFESFLPDGKSVVEYCRSAIEPNGSEIEQYGIVALTELLLKPAGFGLEIFYLDRSPGEEVHTYKFHDPSDSGRVLFEGPVIRLLYRPGHYDMLYELEDPPLGSAQPGNTVFVALATQMETVMPIEADYTSMFSGLLPSEPSNTTFFARPQPSQISNMTNCRTERTGDHTPYLFRRSRFESEPSLTSLAGQNLQTKPLLESPHNRAHYNNEEFQPHIWGHDNSGSGSDARNQKS